MVKALLHKRENLLPLTTGEGRGEGTGKKCIL